MSLFLKPPAISNSKISFQAVADEKLDQFKEAVCDISWDLVAGCANPNVILDNANTVFRACLNKNFSVKEKVASRNVPYKSCVTNEIRALIEERNKIQRIFSKQAITYSDQFR